MKSQDLAKFKLPDNPGIYRFFENDTLLYIGRATSLKDRVRSYFANDLIETRGRLLVDMVARATKIEWQETTNVLESIFVEAALIKDHQPPYNTEGKDNKSFLWVILTDEKFPAAVMVRGRELALAEQGIKKLPFSIKSQYGPFQSGAIVREAMKLVRRIFPYRDEKCVPMEEKGFSRPCFNRQIGLCPGACVGAVTPEEYAKTVRRLSLFLGGNVKQLKKTLERDMKVAIKEEEFEQAGALAKTIYALDHVFDVSLIKDTDISIKAGGKVHVPVLSRIEAFDVAHTGGKDARGVMTVLIDGEIQKSKYRTFKLNRTTAGDDVGGLREILERRLVHEEWGLPDLVVVDGGITQERAAKVILSRFGLARVPIVAVTKNDRHRVQKIMGNRTIVAAYEDKIILVNAEAHRFSLGRHKRARSKSFLK